jgi:hypothetical protein
MLCVRWTATAPQCARCQAGEAKARGQLDGKGKNARFFGLLGVAALPDGGCVLADRDNCVVRHVTADGTVSTLAGSGEIGNHDASELLQASFSNPSSAAADVSGQVVVCDNSTDWTYALLRVISPAARSVRTVTLRDNAAPGVAVQLTVDTKIAIDAGGNIVCVNPSGVHLVTNCGLAPGYNAYWQLVFWRAPNAWLDRHLGLGSSAACKPSSKAALMTIFLIANRLIHAEAAVGAEHGPDPLKLISKRCALGHNPPATISTPRAALREMSGYKEIIAINRLKSMQFSCRDFREERANALSTVLWHRVLGMLQPWQIRVLG